MNDRGILGRIDLSIDYCPLTIDYWARLRRELSRLSAEFRGRRVRMGIVKKTALVIVFLLVAEFLYLDSNPLSSGLPFRSVQYKPDDLAGEGAPSGQVGWATPFKVDPVLLACDVSVAVLLVLLLVRCVPSAVVVPVVQGCVLGSAAGGAALGFDAEGIIGVVMALTTKDFYKGMTSHTDHRIW